MLKANENSINMKIVNKKRKKRINEFIDKDHEVMHEYYEICNRDISYKQMLNEMYRLMKVDEDFYDSYLTASEILFSTGKEKEGEAILQEAYHRALLTIVDAEGRWPKVMDWGF